MCIFFHHSIIYFGIWVVSRQVDTLKRIFFCFHPIPSSFRHPINLILAFVCIYMKAACTQCVRWHRFLDAGKNTHFSTIRKRNKKKLIPVSDTKPRPKVANTKRDRENARRKNKIKNLLTYANKKIMLMTEMKEEEREWEKKSKKIHLISNGKALLPIRWVSMINDLVVHLNQIWMILLFSYTP
jgi:hypothetical protein